MKTTVGFTLLELILTISTLAILAVAGIDLYHGTARQAELASAARSLVFDLRQARTKALTGENELRWGVRLVNGGNDYYELFSTPTTYSDVSTTVAISVYLSGGVSFSDPAENATKEIVFSKITGSTSATSTVLTASLGTSQTITVTANGAVY